MNSLITLTGFDIHLNWSNSMMQWLKRWSSALGISLLAACSGGSDVTPHLVDTAKANPNLTVLVEAVVPCVKTELPTVSTG